MPLLYNFDIDTPEELLTILAQNLQQRRLEKGLSRDALSILSGVPVPTIASSNKSIPYLWLRTWRWQKH